MMNLETLQTAVIIWANEKGIVKRENADKQFLKFDEESGELSGAIVKNSHHLIVDSIGDTLVTLVILAADLQYNIKLQSIDNLVKENTPNEIPTTFYVRELIRLKGLLVNGYNEEIISWCVETTLQIAYCLGLEPAYCLETAYNVIKKRKGKTVNGTFIKEEDLCEQ